jgi:hypothetical protein
VIPPFDPATGNLPPGVHEATLDEIADRFGTTPHRRRLLEGFVAAVEVLWSVGCRRIYLDGSFVTTKVVSGDFDACWDVEGVDFDRLRSIAPALRDLKEGRGEQLRRYGGELIPYVTPRNAEELTVASILTTFQEDKYTGAAKGIIVIESGGEP